MTFINLKKFENKLRASGAPESTVSNYMVDVRQFIKWQHEYKIQSSPSSEKLSIYKEYLQKKYSPASTKRKISVINKYIASSDRAIEKYSPIDAKSSVVLYAGLMLAVVGVTGAIAGGVGSSELVSSPSEVALPEATSMESGDNNMLRAKGLTVVLSSSPTGSSESTGTAYDYVDLRNVTEVSLEHDDEIAMVNKFSHHGDSTIYSGKSEAMIFNSLIVESSFINITPKSPTGGQTLYVESQGDGYAVIAVEREAGQDIDFRWSVDNTPLYNYNNIY